MALEQGLFWVLAGPAECYRKAFLYDRGMHVAALLLVVMMVVHGGRERKPHKKKEKYTMVDPVDINVATPMSPSRQRLQRGPAWLERRELKSHPHVGQSQK